GILLMVVGCITNAARGDNPAAATPSGPPTSPKAAASPLVSAPPTNAATPVPGGEQVTVARVIDGDTFELVDGRKVRVLGIDSCEAETFAGPDATRHAERHIGGETVWLLAEPTGPDTDRYGRLLR